jgi:hypothetical protein
MTSITTRAGKGSPLTHNEVDANFTNLNNDKLDTAGIALGSAASPTLKFTGDPNTGIYSPGADQLAVATNGARRLFVDANGLVGINTSTPDAGSMITIDSGSLASYRAINGVGGFATFGVTDISTSDGFVNCTNNLIFNVNSAERLRIDSSGRLLVGTSSARSNFFNSTITANVLLENDNAVLGVVRNGNNAFSSYLVLAKSRSGSNTIVQADDQLGSVNFQGNDGTEFVEAVQIAAFVDGTPGANDMPGRLVFSTAADGAAFTTERLRITSAGVLQVADAGNITVGTTTGTKIGTATTQKIGFYNATPVVQPTAVADATDAASAITQLNALLTRMRNLGLIAT